MVLFAFAIFITAMVSCIVTGNTVVFALIVGFICFFAVAVKKGFTFDNTFKMSIDGVKTSYVVIKLMFLIGCLTAMWRASGTISFFVYNGISVITPTMFIFIAFLLCTVLSYCLGSSFGVVSTAGVMLMILARSGNVNEIITAGAIMSGAYFGDRSSPVSSSAYLTATITEISPRENTKMLLKTGSIPLLISGVIFVYLSFKNPIANVDESVMNAVADSYNISAIAAIPAIVLLILPMFKCSVSNTILFSSIAAFFVAYIWQDQSITELIKFCIVGYDIDNVYLADIMSGGGISSMLEVILVVLFSSAYAGIFNETEMLNSLQNLFEKMADKIGLFGIHLIVSTVCIMVFCNQTIATILAVQLLKDIYYKKGASNLEIAADVGNSLITVCGMIPWAIACSIPLAMLDVGNEAILWGVFLWLNPLCFIFTKRFFFKRNKNIEQTI